MIKLPKNLIITIYYIILVISIFHLFLIYESLKSIESFKSINSFFLDILISSIFLMLYQKAEEPKKNVIMSSPYLTISILFIGIMVLSLFFLKLVNFGFQTESNQILYYQISTIFLSLLSLGLLIKIHVNLIKKSRT